ncbi:Cobalt-zinc-cadmium resistance protein czcD [Mycetohabitans rhizoxinica HKI 454]|uniref:Cobalt-zinc-cadmium resistance protein czcD n=1 Tax=Mycetohabitans rhizoxinica (strain DSM 19002 / CIP 109453 / HKI 454) TaxID=882378 RepID=E5AMQ2_MYCRK|nr:MULTISPECIES: cation diffusion facilitator family transporter [Mycetohabitans]MCG1048117.1 cation diffusion facilitator family transporter [Mycetohabitans sp. B6]CBW76284.1 Cobalt-zinc-cadmium resistance protein czcD [Mycetohabitans rhizoxinica HKI 454]
MTALLPERQVVAQKSTVVSVVLNTVLMVTQIVVGVLAHSQALIADGVHSLADLVSDFVVLIANRHSGAHPDADHNYGHSRYETVASLFLGSLLIVVGVGMMWRGAQRITDLDGIPPVHVSALVVAVAVLFSKELLFRYMLREAQRVRSAMLVANAWHARSDAASSLVVAVGIVGSLAGWRWLDPIAVAVVGFMIVRMGWIFGWDALQDLSDRALDEQTTRRIREMLLSTPGVQGVHELRTRKMGDAALVDAHILVEPRITVSEGHYIAETARLRVLKEPHVLDALIHVDPENDDERTVWEALPPRDRLRKNLEHELSPRGVQIVSFDIHYLRHGVELDLLLAPGSGAQAGGDRDLTQALDLDAVARRLGVCQIRLRQMVGSAAVHATV